MAKVIIKQSTFELVNRLPYSLCQSVELHPNQKGTTDGLRYLQALRYWQASNPAPAFLHGAVAQSSTASHKPVVWLG